MPSLALADITNNESGLSGSKQGASETSLEEAFKPAHVVLEGNICAGKSTLCALLQEDLEGDIDVCVQSEMTEENFLSAFYDNMKKFGFAFQMFMFSTRVFQVEEGARLAKAKNSLVLTDRGVLGDWCFARKNWLDENMTDEEYEIYRDVATKRALCELPEKVDCTVYLDVDPERCCWRMKNLRKTSAEQGVLQDYMTGIDDCYFEGMLEMLNQGGDALVLRWDQFGESGDVQKKLRETLNGNRPCPKIKYISEDVARFEADRCNVSVDIELERWLETPEDIEAVYKKINKPGTIHSRKPTSQQHVYIRNNMCMLETRRDLICWSNEFKRVVMFYLSLGCVVNFFDEGCDSPEPDSALATIADYSPDSSYSMSPMKL